MHDAHESVISDMAAPWKPFMADYRAHEQTWAWDLRAKYGLPSENTEGCKRIDYLALFVEAQYLMKSKGLDWVDPLGVRVDALRLVREGWRITGIEPARAKNMFLKRFYDLSKDRRQEQWWEHQDGAAVDEDKV